MRAILLSLVFLAGTALSARPSIAFRKFQPISSRTATVTHQSPTNRRPLIGIVSQPGDPAPDNASYIAASYVKLIEAGGGRAVPILFDEPFASLEEKFKKINGLIIPGGGAVLQKGHAFFDTAAYLLQLARDANSVGDYFPVLGICLGFETMMVDAHGSDTILSDVEAEDLPSPLVLLPDAAKSRLFGSLPPQVVWTMQSQPITMENHGKGVTLEDAGASRGLEDFRILAMSGDRNGEPYIAAAEHRTYPLYAVQFHPEKNAFESTDQLHVPYGTDAVKVTQAFSSFLVDEARKSNHYAGGWEIESALWIDNIPPVFTGKSAHEGGLESDFELCYFMPYYSYEGTGVEGRFGWVGDGAAGRD